VLNQQVAIEEIGAAYPQPVGRICKPNSREKLAKDS